MPLPSERPASFITVADIVSLRPEAEVGRVHARPVVARVPDLETTGDDAFEEPVADYMRTELLPAGRLILDDSVAVMVKSAAPPPAPILADLDLLEPSLGERSTTTGALQFLRDCPTEIRGPDTHRVSLDEPLGFPATVAPSSLGRDRRRLSAAALAELHRPNRIDRIGGSKTAAVLVAVTTPGCVS